MQNNKFSYIKQHIFSMGEIALYWKKTRTPIDEEMSKFQRRGFDSLQIFKGLTESLVRG